MELTRTQKIILAIVGGLLLIGLALWIFRKPKKFKEESYLGDEALLLASQVDEMNSTLENKINALEQKQEGSQLQEKPDDSFPLRMGSVGKRVEQLQAFLVRKFGANIIANGIWDENTQEAVEKNLKQKEISQNIFEAYNLAIIKTSIFK
ncbi:MAG: hypothetical protein OHK0045_25440 [Raineya sp.]